MDTSKLLAILCCFVLIVCLVLSISTLVVLRNAIAENEVLQNDAKELVSELDGYVEELNQNKPNDDSISASVNTEQSGTKWDSFCIKETNGLIGIYASDGTLLKVLDISVSTLPPADRNALSKGIQIDSWRELIALMQDYTA